MPGQNETQGATDAGPTARPFTTDELVELLGLTRTIYVNGDSPLHAGFADEKTRKRRRAEAKALRASAHRLRGVKLDREKEKRFFESSPVLTHVYRFAMTRSANPWAVLTVAIAEAVARIPPRWAFCPELGNRGSVSFIVGLLGISGASKGLNTDAGSKAFAWPKTIFEPRRVKPKSGASFVKGYCKKITLLDEAKFYGRDDVIAALSDGNAAGKSSTNRVTAAMAVLDSGSDGKAWRQIWHNAVFDFPEVSDINKGNKGTEFASTLVAMFSQERLGGEALSEEFDGSVEPCRSVGVAVMGVQPANFEVLRQHAGLGLPQRCFLIDVAGRTGTDTFNEYVDFSGLVEDNGTIAPLLLAGIPGMTAQRELKIREEVMQDLPQLAVSMPDHIRREAAVEMHGRLSYPEDYSPLDRHEGLVKMSIALGLAYLHGFYDCDGVGFTEQHWRWAEVLMIKHHQARDAVMQAAEEEETGRVIEQGNKQNLMDIARKEGSHRNSVLVCKTKIRSIVRSRANKTGANESVRLPLNQFTVPQRSRIPEALAEMRNDGEIVDFTIDVTERDVDGTKKAFVSGVRVEATASRLGDDE